jgi:hypothetical protein
VDVTVAEQRALGGFKPFRRRVDYEEAQPVPIEVAKTQLLLTASANWGYQLRRGLITLDADDVAVLRELMLRR